MTFRARVIVTIAAAVAVAVLASCLASYLSTRNALARAVDESLYAAAGAGPNGTRPNEGGTVAGVSYQIILPDCSAVPESELSVDAQACHAANGGTRDFLRTVSTDDGAYRELIHPLPADVIKVPCGNGSTQLCVLGTTSAQLFSVNITGQQHQLHILAFRLWLIALIGVLAAIALGYLAARTALEPLEEVTNRIEEVAETSDIAYRFEPGRTDELGRLRRVFNKLLGSVDDSQKVQRQLVLDASHELRTPLTSLRTNAQVLSRADQLAPGELEQIATDMISQVDELAALISDLAELARGEEIDGTVETLAFDDIVDECVASARLHARARDVSIDATTTTCTIRGRRDRVARAVTNLLSNAIKFAPEHGHVLVTLRDGALSVADDGPGVDPSDVPYVFDRFWRSPRARALPGSGLGLAIVRQVAEESGGSVTVRRSGELGGAEFVLAIPPAADDSVNS